MKFIVIDGNIGCGKTTLINNLEKFLNKERVFILREDVDQWKKAREESLDEQFQGDSPSGEYNFFGKNEELFD